MKVSEEVLWICCTPLFSLPSQPTEQRFAMLGKMTSFALVDME